MQYNLCVESRQFLLLLLLLDYYLYILYITLTPTFTMLQLCYELWVIFKAKSGEVCTAIRGTLWTL